MVTRDMYITMLEKRASDGIDLFSGVDNQEAANKEHSSNILDQRSDVSSLFANSDKASKDTTSALAKALPKAKKTEGTSGSNTMLKVAMNTAFFDGLRETGLLKTASPEYIRAAYGSFSDELDKIAKMMPGEVMKHLNKVRKPAKSRLTLKPTGQKSTFQLAKAAGLGTAFKGIAAKATKASKPKPKQWGPGTVLKGSKTTKPSTVNFGGY